MGVKENHEPVQCPTCGAWIPPKSVFCPECNAILLIGIIQEYLDDEEDD